MKYLLTFILFMLLFPLLGCNPSRGINDITDVDKYAPGVWIVDEPISSGAIDVPNYVKKIVVNSDKTFSEYLALITDDGWPTKPTTIGVWHANIGKYYNTGRQYYCLTMNSTADEYGAGAEYTLIMIDSRKIRGVTDEIYIKGERDPFTHNSKPTQPLDQHVERIKEKELPIAGTTEKVNAKDSTVLIEIPTGSFTMGNEYGENDEKPVHTVYLDKYYISKYEVTVKQYKKYCIAIGKAMSAQPAWNNADNSPVVNVTWNDAKEYCDWADLRLPTEAEWEKAARGPDGQLYPWGNDWDVSKCNSGDSSDGYVYTAPVGSFPTGVSSYGCFDMAGNVWEWCNDWYSNKYYLDSPSNNPTGPSEGTLRVIRGGCWSYGVNSFCRSTYRGKSAPGGRFIYYGFRPAK